MIKAILFDAYGTLFDVYSVSARAEQLFPGQGMALAAMWRDRQIEYTRLVSLSDPHTAGGTRHYLPFWDLTRRALRYCAKRMGLNLGKEEEAALMAEYACLSAFPENLGVLRELRALGMPTGILSNGNAEMLDVVVKSAGMGELFDHLLSVDAVRRFKTAPESYQLGPDAFGVPAREILLIRP
ncbi:MAG: haloacid dehalogenase type II, partial [Candidatus Protistobacter heckmanni]|nr:haloacid dehalogenase type II [Candidatus Protistobacter heckmanni]